MRRSIVIALLLAGACSKKPRVADPATPPVPESTPVRAADAAMSLPDAAAARDATLTLHTPTSHRPKPVACASKAAKPVGGSPRQDECARDADCAKGEVCECDKSGRRMPPHNACSHGNCAVDTDCGPGGFCSPQRDICNGGSLGFFCHTAADQCGSDEDCSGGNHCDFSAPLGHWACAADPGCPKG